MGTVFSFSDSSVNNTQTTIANLSQIYNGNCSIDAEDIISGDNITSGGNVTIDENATIQNASCYMSTSLDSVTDILQKAQNTAAANPAVGGLFSLAAVDISSVSSSEFAETNISNTVNQNCNVQSIDQLVGTVIDAVGNVVIDQSSVNNNANCTLNTTMSAVANMQQFATNSAQSGKSKGKGGLLGSLGGIIILIIILGVVASIMGKKNPQTGTSASGVSVGLPISAIPTK